MLRITETQSSTGTTLRVEGKLLAPWVDELTRAHAAVAARFQCVHLDLGGLTYLDDSGARVLRAMTQNGASILTCSDFVAEYLKGWDHA